MTLSMIAIASGKDDLPSEEPLIRRAKTPRPQMAAFIANQGRKRKGLIPASYAARARK